jgi:hypothetical protein
LPAYSIAGPQAASGVVYLLAAAFGHRLARLAFATGSIASYSRQDRRALEQ